MGGIPKESMKTFNPLKIATHFVVEKCTLFLLVYVRTLSVLHPIVLEQPQLVLEIIAPPKEHSTECSTLLKEYVQQTIARMCVPVVAQPGE